MQHRTSMMAELPFAGDALPTGRILVVDDEPNIRRICAVRLAQQGHEVVTAEDGESGWAALNESDYDLVITDQEMPKLTGLGLLRRVRDAGMTIPGMLTSGRMPFNDPEFIDLVPPGSRLPKPFSIEDLVSKVEHLLLMARAR